LDKTSSNGKEENNKSRVVRFMNPQKGFIQPVLYKAVGQKDESLPKEPFLK
jgi:hypothetical protein